MKKIIDNFESIHPRDSIEWLRDYRRALRNTPHGRLQLVTSNLKHMHGITLERYEEIYRQQRGVCAICSKAIVKAYSLESTGKRGPKRNSAHLDHDPACCPGRKSCGRCIRALLCANCNTGIGMFKHRAELLRLAIEYVTRPRQRSI